MNVQEYAAQDAVGLRALITEGAVSTAEVECAAREAIESVDGRLNALSMPLFDKPLQSAADGPLSGVPFLLKNAGPYAEGVPFDVGTKLFVGAVAGTDALVTRRFRAAGLTMLGLTNAPEMALRFATESRLHGVTRNPWNLERGTGGSSGGAAALVAAGAVPIAHGKDGAGSIRVPAGAGLRQPGTAAHDLPPRATLARRDQGRRDRRGSRRGPSAGRCADPARSGAGRDGARRRR